MPAIKVTETLKAQNSKFFEGHAIGAIVEKRFPYEFKVGEFAFQNYKDRTDLHAEHGWQEVVRPPLLENQKYTGLIIEVEGVYTQQVADLTQEEILNRKLNEAESARQARLQEEQVKIVEEKFQAIVDTDEILANEDAFPLWRNFDDGFAFALDFKVRDFNDANELKTYKVIQAHNKQADWMPRIVPALFVLVQPEGATEWEAGASYQVNDVRTYLGVEYKCIQAHTAIVGWEPPNVPSLWTLNV